MHTDFNIQSLDGPLDIENAIIDKLGKNDIKWESLGEMHDPRPVQTEKVLGVELGARTP